MGNGEATTSNLQDVLTQRTLELCAIPSVIGHEAAIADHVATWAAKHFLSEDVVRVSHSFVLGRRQDSRPTVALIGHLDTVPAHSTDAPPRIEGGRLHGLGSSDMKGGIAVMMQLAETLPLEKLPYNLMLVLYEREEGPYLENGLGPLMLAVPELGNIKLGIAMEPTDNEIQVGCVGTLHAVLRFRGQSAHSARPWQGKNAIHAAGPLLAELLSMPRREVLHQGQSFYEVMSVTTAHGGRARNVVPDLFELNLNYRFAPGKALEVAQQEVLSLVAGRADVEFTDLSPSGHVPQDNPLFQKFCDQSGLPVRAKQAWTDVGRLSAHGIDAVNFGPGETAQAHQAHESAPLAAMVQSYDVLHKFLTTA